jgi:hypothetical protein
MAPLRRIRERLGLSGARPERTLWVMGGDLAAYEALAPVIAAMRERHPRTEILLTPGDAELRRRLAERFPSCAVLPPPVAAGPLVRIFIRNRNIRSAVLAEPREVPPAAVMRTLGRMAIAIVATTSGGNRMLAPGQALAGACETVVGMTPEAGEAGRRQLAPAEFADMLRNLIARDLKPLRQEAKAVPGIGAALVWLSRNAGLRRLIGWRLWRYATLEELRAAIGAPETILCLGNGPSSEEPALDGIAHDALFRVNHSWIERGKFTVPDVVFTGGKPTLRALAQPIFGVMTRYAEEHCAKIRSFALSRHRGRYFNARELAPEIDAFPWGHLRPTNGASMMAVAVALQPARLIVAGIDLFQHQAGSYPGDSATPNAYSPGHSRDTELAFLLKVLSNYRGELVILSEALRIEREKALAAPEAGRTCP